MSEHETEKDDLTPAQVVAMEYEGYLHSPSLDRAWIAGWHAAINHATSALARAGYASTPPGATT